MVIIMIHYDPWGSGNYRPLAPFLCEVASHVKNCHFGDYYCYFDYVLSLF